MLPAPAADLTVEAALDQMEAMARLAAESDLTVHVVVPRAAWVVDAARRLADELGIECEVSMRARTIRARFSPAARG